MAVRERESQAHGCWWIIAKDERGKTILIFGSDKDEQSAREKAFEMLPGIDFDIRRLPTRNLQRASSLLKGDRLERTHSLKKATERLRHKVG